MTKEERLDRLIEVAYYKLSQDQKIDVLDIPKVFRESRKAIAEGATVEQAVREAILRYCEESNPCGK